MQISTGHQLFQLSGALMILLAYVGHQFKWLNAAGASYNVLNGVGSAILGFYAVWPRPQYGFIVLEFVWVFVSIYGFARALRMEKASGQRA